MVRAVPITLCLISLALLPVSGIAQETEQPVGDAAASDAVVTTTEEEDGPRVFEDRIVVTASRQEEESGNTLAPISVIDAQMIEQYQPEKMADLFKQIPGVEIQGEGPFRGLPVIRGLSSNRVLILVDGQRLNNSRESTQFAGIQPGLVNLSEVERIEVLRGPASVQYGSDAIGGVINIITKRPDLGEETFKIDGNVAYGYGTSSESNNANFQVTGTGEKFGFTVGGVYQTAENYTAADGASEDEEFGQYVDEDNRVYNSGMEQSAFDTTLRFLTGDKGVFKVNAEVVRTKDVGFPGFDPATSGIDIEFPVFDRDKLGLAWSSGPMWGLEDVSFSTYYQGVHKESKRDFVFPGFASLSNTISEIDSIGFNAQGIADVGVNRLVFGIDAYRDKLDDTAESQLCFGPTFCLPPSDEVAVPKSKQTGLGIYIQDQISVSDQVTLHAGLRGDTYDFISEDDPDYTGKPFDVTDSDVSGNVGVSWAVTDHVNVTAMIARGFRSPNLQERSFNGLASTGDTLIIQNFDLTSERSLNYEFGFKARYDRYSGGLHFFYNDLTDFISFEFIGEDPESGLLLAQFANIDKATIRGIELDLDTIFATWWSLFTNVSYTEGDNETTNEPLSAIPPFKLIVGLRYQRTRWWAETSARIVGSQDRLPTDDPRFEKGVPGFTVYDVRAGYDFPFGLAVLASLENFTDKLYAEPFNNRPEPGRNLRLSVRYKF
jgi:TonB-dependent heme/hemoglobin receptor